MPEKSWACFFHLQGLVKLDYVYNPMPPVPGQAYPSHPLQQVEQY